ncbi:hypothetical protein [Streptomyces sp. NPDC048191]|uniref:hypothetical protein n=1 Tax=Streptomyces sp. NPDC048191 TaxID=3155484 RepID=UPI0034107046
MAEGNRSSNGSNRAELSLREEIRRDAIDSWISSHPDDPVPETTRQVLALWVKEQITAVGELPERRISRLQGEALVHAAQVRELNSIAPDDLPAVEKAVRAAYWSENSRSSWSMALDDFVEDHPVFFMPFAFLLFVVPVWASWGWLFNSTDFHGFPAGGFFIMGSLFALLLVVHGRILAVLSLISPKLCAPWRVAAVAIVAYLVAWQDWRVDFHSSFPEWEDQIPRDFNPAVSHSDVSLIYSMKAFAVLVSLGLIGSAFAAAVHRAGPKEPQGAVITSRMVLELLSLAKLSQAVVEDPEDDTAEEGFRPYLASSERRNILHHLDRLARLAEGRWKRSLRVGDRVADSAVIEVGDGIAASARKWKAVAATGGERLAEMDQAFASALIEASRGNWGRLAVEVSGTELLRRRLLKGLRRVSALFVMLGAACTVLIDPFSWFSKSPSPAVSSFLLLIAAILGVTIDPTIVEPLGNASKVSDYFTSKK